MSQKVKLAETTKAWQSACAHSSDPGIVSPTVDLDTAELLCKETGKVAHDKYWFCHTYCAGQGVGRETAESIWEDAVTLPAPTETIALLACVPSLARRFCPSVGDVHGGTHRLIGATLETSSATSEFLINQLRAGVFVTNVLHITTPYE